MGRLSRSPPRPVAGSFSGPLPVLARNAQHDLADVASGIEAEVIDPRTLSPLDGETILESVAKTGRLVVVDECHRRCGVAA